MAFEQQTEIEHQKELIAKYSGRLRVLEQQAAGYGSLAVPAHIVLDIEETQQALAKAESELKYLVENLASGVTPYLGLKTFQEQDKNLFFGREALITHFLEKMKRASLLAVLGPSGSGKSSVVLAGVVPAMRSGALEGSKNWLYLKIRPGARPLDALASGLAALHGDPIAGVRYSTTLSENVRALLIVVQTILEIKQSPRLVLIVDQFEELWTQAPAEADAQKTFREQEQEPFINLLLTAAAAPGSPIQIILTMRADFLHRAAEHRELAAVISERLVLVSPMSPVDLRMAIERPAHQAGGSFEPGLVDELIEQVNGEPGCLPLLQFTLFELWKEAAQHSNGLMTFTAYQKLGRVKGALAKRADKILTEQSPDDQHQLHDILLRLVQPGDGTTDTRRRVLLSDLVPADDTEAHVQKLIEPLVEARLLTTGHDEQDQMTVELSHEALIRNWPTMRQWIDEARADLRLQLQLVEAAKEWQANDKNPGFLWSEVRLSAIDAWRTRANPQLTSLQAQFLAKSRAEVERMAQEREERRRKEEQLAAEQRMGRQLRYLRQAASMGVGTGLGYGIALTYIAYIADTTRPLTVLIILFFSFFLPGAAVGFSIGLALWYWNSNARHKRLGTSVVGTIVGLICYALFILLSKKPADLVSASTFLQIATGALFGLALGLGASLTYQKNTQYLSIVLLSLLVGTLGLQISGAASNIISAMVASGLIGGLAGLGLYVFAFQPDIPVPATEFAHAQAIG